MASFTGSAFANFYKRILQFNRATNVGVGTSLNAITDGDGGKTSIELSDDVLWVKPQNDNTTSSLLVTNTASTQMFAVDTTNEKVLIGRSQIAANTQYAHFQVSATDSFWSGCLADTFYAVPFNGNGSFPILTIANASLGSSTSSSFNDQNPATSLTISNSAHDIVNCYWYVPDNITIDAVKWFHAADTDTGDTTVGHLMGYDLDVGNGSTSGDLSNGTVLADGSTITNAGREQIYYQSMTIQSANVDAGKVILFAFASDTVNSDYSINVTVKYHLR